MVIYKGNKAKKGSMLMTNYDIKKKNDRSDLSFYWTIQRQTGWSNNNASFKDGEKSTIKLNAIELGFMVSVVNSVLSKGSISKWNTVHQSDNGTTSISFWHKERDDKDASDISNHGFFFSMKKGDNKFTIGISVGEFYGIQAEVDAGMRELIALNVEEDNQRRAKNAKNNSNSNNDASDTSNDVDDDSSDEEDDDVPF